MLFFLLKWNFSLNKNYKVWVFKIIFLLDNWGPRIIGLARAIKCLERANFYQY